MNKTKRKIGVINIIIMTLIVITIMLICCSIGRYNVSVVDVFHSLSNYFFNTNYNIERKAYNSVIFMRLPRTVMAASIGMALSVSGCVYQSIFNNKLISPDLLGVTEGSCVGAALAILLGGTGLSIIMGSFVCGILAVVFVLLLSAAMKNNSNITLVLSGIIVSAIFSSILGMIKYTVDSLEKLETITFWIMGSFASVSMTEVRNSLPLLISGTAVLILLGYQINIISLGQNEAEMLGVRFKFVRITVIACATVLTACSTAICGTVSWIGLIIPHIARAIFGNNNKYAIPASAFIGAAILPVIDTFCRTLTVNEIPVSIVSAAFGAVVYSFILLKKGNIIHD